MIKSNVWLEQKSGSDTFVRGCLLKPHDQENPTATVRVEESGEVLELPPERFWPVNQPWQIGGADLTSLSHLDVPNLLHALQERYERGHIYTRIASVLVAVNPYRSLPIYGPAYMQKYHGTQLHHDSPHVFGLSEKAFQAALETGRSQSMLICGESGAGKTMSATLVMSFVSDRTKLVAADAVVDDGHVQHRIVRASRVLESFGNSCTVLNENSSRFGKFTRLHLSRSDGSVRGATSSTYLLEKSRVVAQPEGERNFHIFYEILNGLSEAQLATLDLDKKSTFNYLSANSPLPVDANLERRFKKTRSALLALGISEEDLQQLLAVLSAILHIGELRFEGDEDEASVSDDSVVHLGTFANLLGFEESIASQNLLSQTVSVGSESFTRTLGIDDAIEARDAVAKALYEGVFQFVVDRMNASLDVSEVDDERDDDLFIGILDVFGFESFEVNGFEQFCINYANEVLQSHFNDAVLNDEMEIYKKEMVAYEPLQMHVLDNSATINLIAHRNNGILALLDTACSIGSGDPLTFEDTVFRVHKLHESLARAPPRRSGRRRRFSQRKLKVSSNGFVIRHYACDVTYCPDLFLEKNRDRINPDSVNLFHTSSRSLVRNLYPEVPTSAHQASVGSSFAASLDNLMKTIKETTPHFIRCVKSSRDCSGKFSASYIAPQIRNGGLVTACRMLKAALPSHVPLTNLSTALGHANAPDALQAEAVALALGARKGRYRIGRTLILSREPLPRPIHALDRRKALRILVQLRFQRVLALFRAMRVFKRVAASVKIQRLFSVVLVLMRLRKRCEQCRQTVVERKERELMMERKAREELEVRRKKESTKQVRELTELGNIQELARNARELEERTRRDVAERKARDERDQGGLSRQHSRKSDCSRTRLSRQRSSSHFRRRKGERLLREELNRERNRANERERWLVQQLEEARDVSVSEREKLRIKSEAHNIVMEAFQADLEHERRTVSFTRRKLADAKRDNEELRRLLREQKEEMKSAQSMKEVNLQRERRMRQDLEELTYAHRQACDEVEQARDSLSSMQAELLERIKQFEIENERRENEVMEIHREFILLKGMVQKLQKSIQAAREEYIGSGASATAPRLIQDNQPDPVELELEIVQKKLEKTEMKLKEVERNINQRYQQWDVDRKSQQPMVDNSNRASNTDVTSSTDNSSSK